MGLSGKIAIFILSVSIAAAQSGEEFFEKSVRPLLARNCFGCHSSTARIPFAGLRLDSREGLMKGGDHGPAIVPGKPDESALIRAVRFEGPRMPPGGKLSQAEIDVLVQWVKSGSVWPEERSLTSVSKTGRPGLDHWAWKPVEKPRPPDGPGDPIDRFIQAGLRRKNLKPAPAADPRALMRRVSYALTGLPPSWEDVTSFQRDSSDGAYPRVVDKLLASGHFGERWARHWLDLARYSDAAGARLPQAHLYRDWVIAAFNSDMPYDQFVKRQLAADQIRSEGSKHLAALGFLTLGLNPARFSDFPERMDDRIDVVTRGLLGITGACARCHDHKYDPILTRDYYSLYGVFANSPEPHDPPLLASPAIGPLSEYYKSRLQMRQDQLSKFRRKAVEEYMSEIRAAEPIEKYVTAAWDARRMNGAQVEALARERDLPVYLMRKWHRFSGQELRPVFERWESLPETERKREIQHWVRNVLEADQSEPHSDPGKETLRRMLRGVNSPMHIPVEDLAYVVKEDDSNTINTLARHYRGLLADYGVRDNPPVTRTIAEREEWIPSHVFIRGNQNDLGAETPPRFPDFLGGGKGAEFERGRTRLDLAEAIVSKSNPLAARVIVNRVWMHLCGQGLVRTPSDFGTRGDPPSHHELLDHLASGLMEDGWSLKRLIRRIVLTQTYRQSARASSESRAADPENLLLSHANGARLDFEGLRDSMLVSSGKLDGTLGGPPFLLAATPVVPRRTVYAFIERSRPDGALSSFDFADTEQHTPRRQITTIPQQALFLMNSSFVLEQARQLASRSEGSGGERERLTRMYQFALGRHPLPNEVEQAIQFLRTWSDSAAQNEKDSPWRYGYGELDISSGKVKEFHPFTHFAPQVLAGGPGARPKAWLPKSILPDARAGFAHLTAGGGSPGDDPRAAVIRRWVSPVDGKVSIAGLLKDKLDNYDRRFNLTNGIRGWVVTSLGGIVANWTVLDMEVATGLKGVAVRKGDTVDFVVDSRGDYEQDHFDWAPVITAGGNRRWSAEDDFQGPAQKPLSAWDQIAQALLMTNEFAFVD